MQSLEGKNIIELSTGSAPEAESLCRSLEAQRATCLIGMICTFPCDIGEEDSTIVTAGNEDLWAQSESMLKTLAGRSSYIGKQVGSLAWPEDKVLSHIREQAGKHFDPGVVDVFLRNFETIKLHGKIS